MISPAWESYHENNKKWTVSFETETKINLVCGWTKTKNWLCEWIEVKAVLWIVLFSTNPKTVTKAKMEKVMTNQCTFPSIR